MCAMVMFLGFYHLSLIQRNMTTNEHSNCSRYHYLLDETKKYHNPFNMNKSTLQNLMEVISPSQRVYYTRIEALRGELQIMQV
jgi:hypothetical protein